MLCGLAYVGRQTHENRAQKVRRMMRRREKYDGVSNADISNAVDLWVRGDRNRRIVKRFLIDLSTYEQIAEDEDISVAQTKRDIAKWESVLFQHM